MSDKRKQDRAPLDIYLNKFIRGVPYTARASDISREGVGLSRLIEPEHADQRVGLQFQLPGSEEVIYVEGEVVREWLDPVRAEGAGVRFTLITERHRRMIDAYVARHGTGH